MTYSHDGEPAFSPRERRRAIFRRVVYVTIVAVWIVIVTRHLIKTHFNQKLVMAYATISLVVVGAPLFNLGVRQKAKALGWKMCPSCYRFGGSQLKMESAGGEGLMEQFRCGKCGRKLTFEELRMKWNGWL